MPSAARLMATIPDVMLFFNHAGGSMVKEAQGAGLVKLHERGGRRVEILPRFWNSHDRGLAIGMYLNDASYLAAMKLFDSSQLQLAHRT
jgi:hypothetical protein